MDVPKEMEWASNGAKKKCTPVNFLLCFFFSSRRRHTRLQGDWSSDVCSSDLGNLHLAEENVRKIFVIVLPGMHQNGRNLRVLPHLSQERSNLRQVGTRSDDIDRKSVV